MNVANGEQLMIVLNLYIYKSKNHCNPRHIHIPIQISEIYIYIYMVAVCLSAEGAKNVSWPWLFPLRRWGSLTMAFTVKSVYI